MTFRPVGALDFEEPIGTIYITAAAPLDPIKKKVAWLPGRFPQRTLDSVAAATVLSDPIEVLGSHVANVVQLGHADVAAIACYVDVLHLVVNRHGVKRQMREQNPAMSLRLDLFEHLAERRQELRVEPRRKL